MTKPSGIPTYPQTDYLPQLADKQAVFAGPFETAIRQLPQRLLVHTEMNASEIAAPLSFRDPVYFNRFFRRLAGQSPAEFRRQFPEKYPF
jgi:hypothetical protein